MKDHKPGEWSGRITRVLGLCAAAGIFMLMALVFTSVFFRYLFNAPILATEDLMAILLGLTIFTALPGVTASRSHITVELFVAPFRKFPALDRARKIIIDVGIVLMSLYMAYLLYLQASRQFDRETESFVMEWPLWPATAAYCVLVFVGALLFALRGWRDKGQSDQKSGLDL